MDDEGWERDVLSENPAVLDGEFSESSGACQKTATYHFLHDSPSPFHPFSVVTFVMSGCGVQQTVRLDTRTEPQEV
jgi:hypothetical protein